MDKLGNIIDSSLAGIIGIVLVCVFIPIATSFIGDLTGDAAQYAPLLSVVIIMMIIGLIIGVISFYRGSQR